MDRREFLKLTGTLGAGLGVLPTLARGATAGTTQAVISKRPYAGGSFGFELDGVASGWLQSVEGGGATADVINEKMGPDHIVKKHLGAVKYEDVSIECGTGMSKAFYQWLVDTTSPKGAARKNGAVISADYNYKEMSRMTFTNALITEIGMPALDATSKDAAKMTIKITPEITRRAAASGTSAGAAAMPKIQKKWLPANFRLKIDGLEEACKAVARIEAITIKQKVASNATGELRDYQKEPAHLEFPNLVVTIDESHAQKFYDWHEDFVIKGNNSDNAEKGGTLEYLTPDLKEVLFTLTFANLGIFRMSHDKSEAGSDNVRRVKCEMYCEKITFNYAAAWA